MHSTFTRIQGVFGSFTTTALVLACLIALSDLLTPRTPSGVIRAESVQVLKGRPHIYSRRKEEYAAIRFSAEADLSSLFGWNTKQVLVYVTAEWPAGAANTSDAAHSAVIWDQIITSPSADHLANLGPATLRKLKLSAKGKGIDPSRGIITLKNQRAKYQISHPSGKMAEIKDVRLRLNYNLQPWVGALVWNRNARLGLWDAMAGGLSASFDFPPLKDKM